MKAVIFDLDDTLVVEHEVARASLVATAELLPCTEPSGFARGVLASARELWRSSVHAALCLELGIASWEGLWATFEGCHPRLAPLREWVPSFCRSTWDRALTELGIDDLSVKGALADRYRQEQASRHTPLPGTTELLEALSRNVPLALLTNGPPDVQRRKLDGARLSRHFEVVVISGEAGVGKPDPRAFDMVLEGLGVQPEEAVMVGNSWERDVQGALAAGVPPLWISSGSPPPGAQVSVRQATTLLEVSDILLG